jgi:hypothetical protein
MSKKTMQILASKVDGIVALEDVTVVDFERFLSAMRCKCVVRHLSLSKPSSSLVRICDEPPLSTLEDWTSVLKLSHRFGHAAMRAFAIKRLDPLISCIDRVIIAHQFEVTAWLPQAYLDVCELSRLPSTEDAHRLGFNVFIKIAAAREAFRVDADVVEAPKRAAIVRNIFGVPPPPSPAGEPANPVSFKEARCSSDLTDMEPPAPSDQPNAPTIPPPVAPPVLATNPSSGTSHHQTGRRRVGSQSASPPRHRAIDPERHCSVVYH